MRRSTEHHGTQEHCVLCGSVGTLFLGPLQDKDFGVSGEFFLQRCPQCNLVWLQDMPPEAGAGAFYANYYTHQPPAAAEGLSSTRRQFVARHWPFTKTQRQRRDELRRFFLPDNGGRLLEAGCGSGVNLAKMRERGWDVVGQDIDPISADSASASYGVDVQVGSLVDVDFANESFDAVLLNHVVEHLREPARDLQRCFELLKPGGQLVIITPNIDSLGARVFGRRWRGLEPPRHLYLYNVSTLDLMLRQSGFHDNHVFSRGARTDMIAFDSVASQLQSWKRIPKYAVAKSVGMMVQILADATRVDRRGAGDELVAVAVRL